MPINPAFPSLHDLKPSGTQGTLRGLLGIGTFNPGNVEHARQLQSVENAIMQGVYGDEDITAFAQKNPQAAPFIQQAVQKRNIFQQNFRPAVQGSPELASTVGGLYAGQEATGQAGPVSQQAESIAARGAPAVNDVPGAVNALLRAGQVDEAKKLMGSGGSEGRYQGPVLFDTNGRTYRATKEGTIERVKVQGDATIAPPVFPFTTVDPVTGQPMQSVISRPEAARRARDSGNGTTGLGPSAALKKLPKDAQDALGAAPSVYKSLDTMEKTVRAGKTGRLRGLLSETEAFFGTDQEAVEHETARNNFRVQAQAIIKGIPSNFDIQSITKTFSHLLAPGSVNQSRINFSRQAMDDLLRANISYHIGQGYAIPDWALELAQSRGIDPDSLKPWDGKSVLVKKGDRFVWGKPTEGGSAPKPTADAYSDSEKERRYQEWKNKRTGR